MPSRIQYDTVVVFSVLGGGLYGATAGCYKSSNLGQSVSGAIFGAIFGSMAGFLYGALSPITIPATLIGGGMWLHETKVKRKPPTCG